MSPQNAVEFADRKARYRPILTSIVALYFLCVQSVTYPGFGRGERRAFSYGWAIQVVLLLLLLLPIVGFAWGRRVRELINDEVARHNLRISLARGFWIAMSFSLGAFLLPASADWTGRQALYFVVTPTLAATLLMFAWLDARANADG